MFCYQSMHELVCEDFVENNNDNNNAKSIRK